MKSNVLISLFIFIVFACVVVSGVESIHLILKSIIYMASMGALLFAGVVYVVDQFEEEAY